jgi:A/G-specific adenine glycosylase
MTGRVADRLLRWFDQHGRRDLPWQQDGPHGRRDAYRVWLSEVMLQQTQVATVIPYFHRFVEALPTLGHLARADEDSVLALWSGLGYYRRARFLHQAAQRCAEIHGGELPRDFDALHALPGIGRSTAGAILAQAHGLRFPILDGNVKRVLTRYHGIHGDRAKCSRDNPGSSPNHTPDQRAADYTQAIMDLGATVCVRNQRAAATARCRKTAWPAAGPHRQLPTAKPGKRQPVRSTLMLILRDEQGRVLLERRGPQGVWSGLWSLPEAPDPDAAWRAAEQWARVDDARPLSPFTHVFSHYKLAVEPLLFDRASAHPGVADQPLQRWCDRDECAALGLPAPVRVLLQSLQAEHEESP